MDCQRRSGVTGRILDVGQALVVEQRGPAKQRVDVGGEPVPRADAPDEPASAVLDPEAAPVLGVGAELLQQRVGARNPEIAPALDPCPLVEVNGGQHRSGRAVEQLVRRVVGVCRDEIEQPLLLRGRRLELPRDEQHAHLAVHQARPLVCVGERAIAGEQPAFPDVVPESCECPADPGRSGPERVVGLVRDAIEWMRRPGAARRACGCGVRGNPIGNLPRVGCVPRRRGQGLVHGGIEEMHHPERTPRCARLSSTEGLSQLRCSLEQLQHPLEILRP